MGALEDLAALYGDEEERPQGSALEALAAAYADEDDDLSVEEQRARFYGNAMPQDKLALEDGGYIGAIASGFPGFENRLSQFEEFTQEANPLLAGGLAPMVASQRGIAELIKAVAPERYEAYVEEREAEQARRAGLAQAAMPEDPNVLQEALASLPQMGLSALTGPAMPAVNIAASIGAAADEAESRGLAGPAATIKPVVEGLGIGALESLGVASIAGKGLSKIAKPAAGRLGRAIQSGALGLVGESGTEGLQEGLSIAAEIATGRESEGVLSELTRIGRASAGGGLLGGSLGAGGGALSRSPSRPTSRSPSPSDVSTAPLSFEPGTSSPEAALAQVDALLNEAHRAERERELAELPLEASISETEQQIEALRQLENQAAAASAIAEREAELDYQARLGEESDKITDKFFEPNPNWPNQWKDVVGFDQSIGERAERMVEEKENGPQFPIAPKIIEFGGNLGVYSEFDSKADDFPKPVGPTEEVLDETLDMARQIDHAAASKEAVAIAQAPDSTFDAIMLGDPSRLGSPEYFAAQRTQLEERLANIRGQYEQMKAGVKDAGDGAAKEVMTDAQAREALETIRRGALEQALRMGDPDLFDRLDVKTRRRLVLFPEDMDETISLRNERARSEFGAATLPETMAELRDVSVAAMPAVEAKANKDFDILNKAGNLPANELGAPMSREEFVRGKVLEFQNGLTERFRALMFEAKPDGSNATEVMRKARSLINKTLKSKGLSREQIGFRGDAALERQGIVDEGAEWLQSRFGEKKITDFADAELVALAQEARQQSAPISTYEFIRSELKRRAANEPPVRYGPAKGDPEVAIAQAREGVAKEMEPALRAMLGGDPDLYVPGEGGSWLERNMYWWRRFIGRAGGLLRSNTALGPAKLGPKGGFSNHFWNVDLADPVAPMKDARVRNAAIKFAGEAREASGATRSVLHHKIAVWAAQVQDKLKTYVAAQEANGTPVKLSDLEQQIYEAVNTRQTASLAPELQQIVKDSEPIRSEFKEYARQLAAGDPAKLAEIERLGDAYIFRAYSIHKDPDAFLRKVDRKSEPYKAFYQRVREEGFAALYEEAYRDAAPKLRQAGLSEPEIQILVEKTVNADMVPGLVEAIVKDSISPEDTKSSARARISKATRDTVKERVMDDPNLREILGEEKLFTLAMVQGMEKVAVDMSRLQLTTSLMRIWRDAGLVGRVSSRRTQRISTEDLKRISTDSSPDGIYVTPEVYETLNGINTATDGFDQLASQMIAIVKMGYVANTATALQNWHSLPGAMLVAGGINAPFAALAKKAKMFRYAQLVARELQFPNGGVKSVSRAEVMKFYDGLVNSPEELVGAVQEMQELGLEAGGEMAFELEKAKNALMSGVEAVGSKGVTSFAKRWGNFLMELYRHPDVMMKVMAYQMNLDELRAKAGNVEADKPMRQLAAKRALTMTQNPKSTPEIIRAMNKGKIGAIAFSFAGFQYQMTRNLYYGSKYAFEDAAASVKYGRDAARLEAAGDLIGAGKAREKAHVYGKYAANRAAGVLTGSLIYGDILRRGVGFIWELLGGDDESEKERHIKAILPFEENRANKIAPVASWRSGGKTYMTFVKTGQVDPFDGVMSALRILGENPQGEKGIPTDGAEMGRRVLATMSYLQATYTGLSAFGEAITDFARIAGQDNATASDWGRAAAKAAKKMAFRQGTIAGETVVRGAKAVDAGALEFSSEFPFFEGDPTNADYEKFRRNLVRSATGVGVQTIPVDDYWSSRIHDVWGEASWRRAAREEWKAAATPSARLKVKAKYVDQWESLQNSLWNMSEHGIGSDLTPDAMKKALGDPEVTKYKGDKIPKWMHQKVAYRMPVSLDTYLNESVKGIR